MKKVIGIILLLSLFIVSGCIKKYDVNDIKDYIENNIGIKNYKLDSNPDKIIDSDGYTDSYWHVKYKDIEFDVVDNHHYGMESVTNNLQSDFNKKALDYYYNKYTNKSSITYTIDYIYKEKSLICNVANDNKEIDNTKLQQCYNNIIDFVNTIDFKTYPIKSISIEITNNNGHVKWLTLYSNNKLKSFNEFINE